MTEGQECQLCGGTDFELMDGLYFCIVCQSQSQEFREVVADEGLIFQTTDAPNMTLRITEKAGKRTQPVISPTISPSAIYEVYTILLRLQAKALLKMGAPDEVEGAILSLWMQYLAWKNVAFCKNSNLLNSSSNLSPNKKPKNPLNTTSSDDQVAHGITMLLHEENAQNSFNEIVQNSFNETSVVEEKEDYFVKQTGLRMSLTIAFCYCALISCDSKIYLSDLLHFVINGSLPFFDVYCFLPSKYRHPLIKCHFSRQFSRYLSSYYFTSMVVAKCLNFQKFIQINASEMIARIFISVNLPRVLLPRVLFLYDKVSESMSGLFLEQFTNYSVAKLLPIDIKIMAIVVICLKLTFGIDDRCEYILSNVATSRKKNSFVFTSWLIQLKLRWAVLNGDTVETVLKKNWIDYDDLTIKKVLYTDRRCLSRRKLKKIPTNNKNFNKIFGDSLTASKCKRSTISLFPLKIIGEQELETSNIDVDMKNVFKHSFFNDSVEFLHDLPHDVLALLNKSYNGDEFYDSKPNLLKGRYSALNKIIPVERFPCCRCYHMYSKLSVGEGFAYLRLESLRQKEFSKTFDTLLTLLSGAINERPLILFRGLQLIEKLLFDDQFSEK